MEHEAHDKWGEAGPDACRIRRSSANVGRPDKGKVSVGVDAKDFDRVLKQLLDTPPNQSWDERMPETIRDLKPGARRNRQLRTRPSRERGGSPKN